MLWVHTAPTAPAEVEGESTGGRALASVPELIADAVLSVLQDLGTSEAVPVRVMLRVYDIEVEDSAQMVVPRVVKVMFPAPYETDAGIVPPARVQKEKGVDSVSARVVPHRGRVMPSRRVWVLSTAVCHVVLGCHLRRANASLAPASQSSN